jgi:RNase P subunit RPR2
MKTGDLVTVYGFDGVFKVISVTMIGDKQKLELFNTFKRKDCVTCERLAIPRIYTEL